MAAGEEQSGLSNPAGQLWASLNSATRLDQSLPDLPPGGIDDASFRLLADNLPTLAWIANGDGYIVWFNRRWHDYCGTTPDQMEGWGWQTVHHPDVLPGVLERWRRSIGEGSPFEMIYPLRGADGVYRPFLARAAPVLDASGKVVRWLGKNSDVSAQIRVEAALRESEARFRNMADNAPVMMWVTDASGACTYLNREWFEFTGQTAQEALGLGWLDATHPDDRPEAERTFLAANARREPFRMEYRLRRSDGSYRWAIDAAAPRFSDDGSFCGYIGSVLDIEERHETEDRLKEAEERLRLATEAAEVGFWDLDLLNDVLVWPPIVKAMFGISADVPVSMEDFSKGLHPEDLEPTTTALQAACDPRQRALYDVEYRTIGKEDGVERWVAAKGRGLFDAQGRCTRVIGTAIDVTARKKTEAELQDLNQRLETRVARAIDEKRQAEEALRQSQKLEAIGKLTGGVAHDFNNLLQVIAGNLELLADSIDDPRARRRLDHAQDAVRRGAKLAGQLLAFGRRTPLEPKVINAGKLVRGLDDMLRRTLGDEIEVETTISGGLWNTHADPMQLENAILNLAINARDAMNGSGKLTIEVGNAFLDDDYARLHSDVSAGQYVMIAVTDTGSGISPELIDQVFEPFFSTKPEGQGTGLGLSMVYGFAKQSHGHVKIYSEVAQGTSVKMYLPRSTQREDAPVVRDDAPLVGGRETILVVEDNESVRSTVVDMLSGLGYHVLKAGDAASALAVIESGASIDLLFTDVVMPGPLRSPELARKAKDRLPRIAVLFTSGYTENAIVHGGRLDEGVSLISKPYTRDALARKLRQLLDGRPAPRPQDEDGAKRAASPTADGPPPRLRILVVEDEGLVRLLATDMLEEMGHEVFEAANAEDALRLLGAERYDVLFTDLGLPGMGGGELAGHALRLRPEIAIIFASGRPLTDGDAPDEVLARSIQINKPYTASDLAAKLTLRPDME